MALSCKKRHPGDLWLLDAIDGDGDLMEMESFRSSWGERRATRGETNGDDKAMSEDDNKKQASEMKTNARGVLEVEVHHARVS